jgi:hypothetical protein
MCFQAEDFNNMSLNLDNLRERLSSRRISGNARSNGNMRFDLHESRIDELEYEELAVDTLDSQRTVQAEAVGFVDDQDQTFFINNDLLSRESATLAGPFH